MKEDDIELLCGDIGNKEVRTVSDGGGFPNPVSHATKNNVFSPQTVQPTATTTADSSDRLAVLLSRIPVEIRNLIAGGLAGMVAKTVVAPIDRIKILFQVSSEPFALRHVPTVVRNICQHEGVAALWRGNSAMMLRVFPYSGIQFMAFDKCKSYMVHAKQREGLPLHEQHLSPLESLIAGSVAGVVSVFATYPLDLTRAQLAVHVKSKVDGGRRPTFLNTLTSTYTRMVLFLFLLLFFIWPSILLSHFPLVPSSFLFFCFCHNCVTETTRLPKSVCTTIMLRELLAYFKVSHLLYWEFCRMQESPLQLTNKENVG